MNTRSVGLQRCLNYHDLTPVCTEAKRLFLRGRLANFEVKKQRIVDIYLSGDLSRDGYVAKNRELDGVMAALRERARELSASSALLNKRSQIDAAIMRYCSGARARFAYIR